MGILERRMLPGLVPERPLTRRRQGLHGLGHHRVQALAAGSIEGGPHLEERLHEVFRYTPGRTRGIFVSREKAPPVAGVPR
jgi:hypothetical protein